MAITAPRVAIEEPAATFAMPITALRFEPLVDVQSRNLAEGQADVSIRAGTFENSGFRVGSLSLYDPQTGHYFAEIPIAPSMLGLPVVLTGFDHAASGWNATAGTVAYQWKPIRTNGVTTVGGGEDKTGRAEFYQGYASPVQLAGRTLGADVALAHSRSAGSIPWGDHEFWRSNVRLQLSGSGGQTDVFAGYQSKFFGWPNLYTPFNSNETENLQTTLVVASHRENLGDGDFFQLGGYYRRNKDDYAFNRFAPVGPVHPFQHTTWVYGAGADLRVTTGEWVWNVHGTWVDDELKSTNLTFGRYRERQHGRLAVVPERRWTLPGGNGVRVRAGIAYDDTNRGESRVSPMAEVAYLPRSQAGLLRRVYTSYAESTQTATYTALNAATGAGLFRGNPDLDRSAARNLEIGADAAVGSWTVSSAVFYREDEDLVDWTFRRGVTARAANAVDLETAGWEAVARYSRPRLELVFGYTLFARDADYGAAVVDASFYALNYPRHRLTVAATARLGAGWEIRVDNEARIQEDNTLRRAGGDEAMISALTLSYTPPRFPRLTVSGQVDNVWDSRFEEVPAVPAARRQVTGSLRLSW